MLPTSSHSVIHRPSPCIGFALVELMIGLTIGLLVVIAAVASFGDTNRSSLGIGDSLQLQQVADAAYRVLDFQITQAGAINLVANDPPNGNGPVAVTFSTAYTGFNPADTQSGGRIFSIHGTRTSNQNQTPLDTLRTSRQDNGTSVDCLGATVTGAQAGIRIDSTFFLNNRRLMCRSQGPIPQPIADGIVDFQVRYGVRMGNANGNGNNVRYQFFTADAVADWDRVQAVSVCLQVASAAPNHEAPFTPLIGCRQQPVPADGHLQMVATRLFHLRNIRS